MSHPIFGRRSLECLGTVDDRLVVLAEEVLRVGMDFSVICGHRTKTAQNGAFNYGFSKVRWPNSKHNSFPSKALDFAPYPIDWADEKRFYLLMGLFLTTAFFLEIPLIGGHDWDHDWDMKDQSFFDIGHIQLAA
jgi:hypothetical protein